jgi:hypothetical protein
MSFNHLLAFREAMRQGDLYPGSTKLAGLDPLGLDNKIEKLRAIEAGAKEDMRAFQKNARSYGRNFLLAEIGLLGTAIGVEHYLGRKRNREMVEALNKHKRTMP